MLIILQLNTPRSSICCSLQRTTPLSSFVRHPPEPMCFFSTASSSYLSFMQASSHSLFFFNLLTFLVSTVYQRKKPPSKPCTFPRFGMGCWGREARRVDPRHFVGNQYEVSQCFSSCFRLRILFFCGCLFCFWFELNDDFRHMMSPFVLGGWGFARNGVFFLKRKTCFPRVSRSEFQNPVFCPKDQGIVVPLPETENREKKE